MEIQLKRSVNGLAAYDNGTIKIINGTIDSKSSIAA